MCRYDDIINIDFHVTLIDQLPKSAFYSILELSWASLHPKWKHVPDEDTFVRNSESSILAATRKQSDIPEAPIEVYASKESVIVELIEQISNNW